MSFKSKYRVSFFVRFGELQISCYSEVFTSEQEVEKFSRHIDKSIDVTNVVMQKFNGKYWAPY